MCCLQSKRRFSAIHRSAVVNEFSHGYAFKREMTSTSGCVSDMSFRPCKNSISKRKTKSKDKFMFTWIFFLIGLLSILGGIPWGIHGAGWY